MKVRINIPYPSDTGEIRIEAPEGATLTLEPAAEDGMCATVCFEEDTAARRAIWIVTMQTADVPHSRSAGTYLGIGGKEHRRIHVYCNLAPAEE